MKKIVVFVPIKNADEVRNAIGEAGGGKIGNYDFCFFSTIGLSKFRPLPGANPTIGEIGKIEEVEEERIEFVAEDEDVPEIVAAIRRVHPYEEVVFDVYNLIQFE